MRVDKEKFEAALGQRLLDADAVQPGSGSTVVAAWDGIAPQPGRPVAAFRRPDAARALADVAIRAFRRPVRTCARSALVGSQQRHVAMRRPAGNDLDQALVVEVRESPG